MSSSLRDDFGEVSRGFVSIEIPYRGEFRHPCKELNQSLTAFVFRMKRSHIYSPGPRVSSSGPEHDPSNGSMLYAFVQRSSLHP